MDIKRVGIAGFGLMGSGIVEVCAKAGYDVLVLEATDDFLKNGFAKLEKSLTGAVAKGKIQISEADAVRARVQGTTSVEDLADRDFIIEVIIENLEMKRQLFAKLDAICPSHTIFASNTSSMQIIELAAATKRGDRFVGMHFFNPVPTMKLVEVVRSIQSSDESMAIATKFGESLGKKPIMAKDGAGFIVNLLLVPYLLDAIRALEKGVASKEDIDTGMMLGCGYPMGPLTLLDMVGLDTVYYITHIMFEEFKDSKYSSPPLLKQMVAAGYYGKKSGRGFYNYNTK
ncbi:MAG: 3-hydroxybutyryl-CoA dehydrogenase [Syntrophobacter sp.]